MLEKREELEEKANIEKPTSLEKAESPTIQNDAMVEEKLKSCTSRCQELLLQVRTTLNDIVADKEVMMTETGEIAETTTMETETVTTDSIEVELTEEEKELVKKEAKIQKKEEKRVAPLTFFQSLAIVIIAITPIIDLLFLLFWALPWKYGNLSRKRMARAILFVKLLLTAILGTMVYQETQRLFEYYDSYYYDYNIPDYNMPKYDSPKENQFSFPVESA